jgi:hypothetical protein
MRRWGTVVSLFIASASMGWSSSPAGAEPGDPTIWTVVERVTPTFIEGATRPAVTAKYDEHLYVSFDVRYDVFVVEHDGVSGHLMQLPFGDDVPGQATYIDRGAPPIPGGIAAGTSPAAVAWDENRIDVFVQGADGQLWHAWQNDGEAPFEGWEPLGGQLTSSPMVVSRAAGSLDVFARGTDGQLWHRWYAGGPTWLGWEALGGQLVGAPSGVGFGDGFIEVAARGTDNALWRRYYVPGGAGWQPWHSLGGVLTGEPADDLLQIVVPGTNNTLWAWVDGEGFHEVGPLPQLDTDLAAITDVEYCCNGLGYVYSSLLFGFDDGILYYAEDPF